MLSKRLEIQLTSAALVCSLAGRRVWETEHCLTCCIRPLVWKISYLVETNLESPADTEDTVISLLRGKALDGSLNNLALLGDQVISPVSISQLRLMASYENCSLDKLDRDRMERGYRKTLRYLIESHRFDLSVFPGACFGILRVGRPTSNRVFCSRRRRCTNWQLASSSA